MDVDLCFGNPAVSPISCQLSALYTAPLLPPPTNVMSVVSLLLYLASQAYGANLRSCLSTPVPAFGIDLLMQNRQLLAMLLNIPL